MSDADANPCPTFAPPAPLARVATPAPDGTGAWLAHTPGAAGALDCLEPNEVAIVNLAQPGLDEGEGLFLFAMTFVDEPRVFTYCARTNPMTRRGRLRREVRAGAIRFAADDLGRSWWAYRVRQLARVLDVD